jgi:hypothetical protein
MSKYEQNERNYLKKQIKEDSGFEVKERIKILEDYIDSNRGEIDLLSWEINDWEREIKEYEELLEEENEDE